MNEKWLGKPYYSVDAYLKNTYGEKYYKIALDGGFTCPNRDGTLSYGGCIFCSAGGSGDFAARVTPDSMAAQLRAGRSLFGDKRTGSRFIAYFQAYTGTYAELSYLRSLYESALSQDEVAGISIATRPDCLGPEVLALLCDLQRMRPDKFIWVELGLQTIHEQTAAFIRRGFSLRVFEEAAYALHSAGIPFIVHIILGLPGEEAEDVYQTVRYLNRIPASDGSFFHPFGIKLQLLHILKDTELGRLYESGALPDFTVLSMEAYLDMLIHCLELLHPDIVVHRLTGDGPRALLSAPRWSLHKRTVLNRLHCEMKLRGTYQGRYYYAGGAPDSL